MQKNFGCSFNQGKRTWVVQITGKEIRLFIQSGCVVSIRGKELRSFIHSLVKNLLFNQRKRLGLFIQSGESGEKSLSCSFNIGEKNLVVHSIKGLLWLVRSIKGKELGSFIQSGKKNLGLSFN